MKKTVSILLAVALFLGGLVGCESKRKGSTVSLPAVDAQRAAMEQAGAEKPVEKPSGGGLSIDEIVGTYKMELRNDNGYTQEGEVIFSKNENGQLVVRGGVRDYNPATGTATFTYTDGDYSATETIVFSSENGRISFPVP